MEWALQLQQGIHMLLLKHLQNSGQGLIGLQHACFGYFLRTVARLGYASKWTFPLI